MATRSSSPAHMRAMATPGANPPAGAYLMYFKEDGLLYRKSSDGVETAVGAAGGGNPAGAELDLTTDFTTTTPAVPTQGVTLFSRHRARRLPAIVGPAGLDATLQPALFSNRIAQAGAVNNSTTFSLSNLAVTILNNGGASATAQANATSSFYAAMVRTRISTTANQGTGGSMRSSSAQWFLSSTANLGGFFAVYRCGVPTPLISGNRVFVGMSATTTALPQGTAPSALANKIGFGYDTHTGNWMFLVGGGSTNAMVDLGPAFPVSGAGTNFYEFRLFAPSGAGQVVHWSAQRLNDGTLVQGTHSVGASLPAIGTLLASHFHVSNGAANAQCSLDVQSMYIETDN